MYAWKVWTVWGESYLLAEIGQAEPEGVDAVDSCLNTERIVRSYFPPCFLNKLG